MVESCIDCQWLLEDEFSFYCFNKSCQYWHFENFDELANKMLEFEIEENLDDDLFV